MFSMQIFCVAAAKALSRRVPDDVYPELRNEDEALDDAGASDLLAKAKQAAGISDQEATDAFAEVIFVVN